MSSLSVLLPVYNAGPYLEETLNSLRQQTRQPDQIVVVNDGSNDNSLEILERHRTADSRILLISQENRGVSAARNRGLAACEGEYIALLDADDVCLPRRFEVQLETMDKQQLDLCGSWVSTFGRKERIVRPPTSDAELRFNFLFLGRTIPNPSAMMRRSAIKDLHYDERLVFAEDFGFFLSLLLANPHSRLGNIPEVLMRYRTHSAQASQRHAAKNESALNLLFFEMFNKYGVAATVQQVDLHYQIWKNRKRITLDQLESYLLLMRQLIQWLKQAPQTESLAVRQWEALSKSQRHLKKEGALLIKDVAGEPRSLWEKLFYSSPKT